jgi:DNA polymerase-3 subunit delta
MFAPWANRPGGCPDGTDSIVKDLSDNPVVAGLLTEPPARPKVSPSGRRPIGRPLRLGRETRAELAQREPDCPRCRMPARMACPPLPSPAPVQLDILSAMAKSADSRIVEAVEYVAAPQKHPPRPVCAVYGDEAFLKREVLVRLRQAVLGGGEGDFSFSTFAGRTAELRDVIEELSTIAMFGGDKRLALVEEADDFVTRYREELEDYAAKPRPTGILVLEVKTWPANTRLAKLVAADGLTIDCRPLKPAQVSGWAIAWAKRTHNIQLPAAAANVLVDLAGTELGLLDQELAKLALTAGPGGKVSAEQVGQLVGSWRTKTAWQMLDAALDGDAREALTQLDRLLLAGEQPVAILGQIAATLRRFAAATRLVLAAAAAGRRPVLRNALEQAGVKPFVLQQAERQIRRLGRDRGSQLYQWLLRADLDLKGDSPLPPRLVLENLIVRLAAPGRP